MELDGNICVQKAYEDLMESMSRLVRSQKDAFSIVWFDIYDWMEPEHSSVKADLCGLLTHKLIGRNIGSVVHEAARDESPYYQDTKEWYAFGKSVDELGTYWKELIREEKPFRLRLLIGCLDCYYKTIMPYVKDEMTAFWKDNEPSHPEMVTLKPYREHRARVKATMDIAKTAVDIFTLQNKTDNEEI
jgi:hypothetical protein